MSLPSFPHLSWPIKLVIFVLALGLLISFLNTVTRQQNAAGPNVLSNASFENGISSWYVNKRGTGNGTFSVTSSTQTDGVNSAQIAITSPGSNPWDVELTQYGIQLNSGQLYSGTFWAKASANRTMDVVIQRSSSPYTVFTRQTVSLTTNWQQYTFSFTAPTTLANNFIGFQVGKATGTVWIDDAQFFTGTSTPTPTITITPTPVATNNPSGEAMPVGDIPGWRQIFADDFPTDVPLGSFPGAVWEKWWGYTDNTPDTSKNGRYYPSKVVSIQNGVMNMYIHTENGVHMVAAPIPVLPEATRWAGGRLYGRYAVRFKADPLPRYKVAWLLWPDSGVWPRDGEIDFPEGKLDGTIGGALHWEGTSGQDVFDAFDTSALFPSWHTAVIEWSPGKVDFLLDGAIVHSVTGDRVPDTSMYWVLQTETDDQGAIPDDATAGNVQIDWVTAYAYSPETTITPTTAPTSTPTPTITPTPTSTPIPTPTSSVQTGLTGSYFTNRTLSGTPTVVRIDPAVNFNWASASPATGIPGDNFSVRWTGFVIPQYSQTYRFYTQSNDGVRLWINGVQLVNNWTNHGSTENSGTITLTAGQKYAVKMEHYENTGTAVAQLRWSSPSTPKQIIPQSRLLSK